MVAVKRPPHARRFDKFVLICLQDECVVSGGFIYPLVVKLSLTRSGRLLNQLEQLPVEAEHHQRAGAVPGCLLMGWGGGGGAKWQNVSLSTALRQP